MLWPINCICQKDGLDKYSVGLRKSLGVAGVDKSRTRFIGQRTSDFIQTDVNVH